MTVERMVLKQIILEQQEYFTPPAKLIERDAYQQLKRYFSTPQIIVIAGLRRTGKSTLLQQLRQSHNQGNYFITFDDDRLLRFTVEDFQMLLELFMEIYGEQKTFYFDEIQNVPQWERFARRLHDQGYKVFITGSNATLFSQELGTRLTGRYSQIELYPYSFKELVHHFSPQLSYNDIYTTKQKAAILRVFEDFCLHGGLPEYLSHRQQEYLHFLYEGVIYRDIIARYQIKEHAVKEMIYYLASNIGKEFSYNGMSKLIGVASSTTVSDYASYLQGSYLCFFLPRFNYSLKKQINANKKVYFIDHQLAAAIGFRSSEDRGRMLENIVYIELKRRQCEIYYHKEKKECDFVIRKGHNVIAAIQVCMSMIDPNVRQREISGLIEAMECYALESGLILTYDEAEEINISTTKRSFLIKVIPLWKWLLSS